MSKIGVLIRVPSSSSVPKRKKERPHQKKIFLGTAALVGLNLFFILY